MRDRLAKPGVGLWFSAAEARMWAAWTRDFQRTLRPPERGRDGSVDRQDRLAGEVGTAFEKLGGRVMQTGREDLGVEIALHWLNLSPERRDATGVIAPTRALRDEINMVIRQGLLCWQYAQIKSLLPPDWPLSRSLLTPLDCCPLRLSIGPQD